MDFLPFPGETQFLAFLRANFLDLFPQLLDQSQFNRRARRLAEIVEKLRQSWAMKLGVHLKKDFLLDTKPVPVLSYKRDKRRSDFLATADYGVCKSRNLKYFGSSGIQGVTAYVGLLIEMSEPHSIKPKPLKESITAPEPIRAPCYQFEFGVQSFDETAIGSPLKIVSNHLKMLAEQFNK